MEVNRSVEVDLTYLHLKHNAYALPHTRSYCVLVGTSNFLILRLGNYHRDDFDVMCPNGTFVTSRILLQVLFSAFLILGISIEALF